jgi:hypothetical protein
MYVKINKGENISKSKVQPYCNIVIYSSSDHIMQNIWTQKNCAMRQQNVCRSYFLF